MKKRTQYLILLIIIFIMSAVIPMIVTHAKYVSNINIETDVQIGTMVFNIKQKEGEASTYQLEKAGQVTAKYKLSNKDDDGNINKLDLKYYLKIVDNNDNEITNLQIAVDGYNYIEYKVDNEGNIINEDGNIVNENGEVITEQNLSQQENEELQSSLTTVKKGFGPINLKYDGQTFEEKDLIINISCPENYSGATTLNYKVKIIAEGLFNKDFKQEENAELRIKVVDEDTITNQTQNQQNTNEISNTNQIIDSGNTNEIIDNNNNANNEISNDIENNTTNDKEESSNNQVENQTQNQEENQTENN